MPATSAGRPGRPAARRSQGLPRLALSRTRVMAKALRLVDQEGLEALSMRRLGAALGVEAMSLYHYVDTKDALLDGLSAHLWSEVSLPAERAPDWKVAVAETARSLRRLARAHPNAFPLLLGRPTISEPALRVLDALLRTFRHAGFDDARASRALGTLVAYAVGYAVVELTCGMGQPEVAARRCVVPQASARFADLARALGECNADTQFEFGLSALLAGLTDGNRRSRQTH